MAMSKLALAYGVVLVLLGVGGYLGTGAEHPTALIPAAFGIPVIALGLVAQRERLRMHAMHGIVLLALIGALATFKRGLPVLRLLGGEEVQRPTAVVLSAIMCVVSFAFLIVAIRSFVEARRARTGAV